MAVLLCGALACAGGVMACNKNNSTASAQNPQSTQKPVQYQPNAAELDPPANAPAAFKIDGNRAFQYTKDFVAIGPRPLGSEGHKKAEEFIVNALKSAGAQVDDDSFSQPTSMGTFQMRNIIGKIQGTKPGIIVLAGHYDTNYPLRDKKFVGANDGGSSTGLMLEIAKALGGKTEGYSVWLVFTDGEETTRSLEWDDKDSLYGSRHLAEKWKNDGTAQKVKALMLLDMIGDKDLSIDRDSNSAQWLLDVIYRAAQRRGVQSYFFTRENTITDDHIPFANVGIPVADIIDIDYGFNGVFHHTTEDTMDKLSPKSLQIVGDVVAETIRALNTK